MRPSESVTVTVTLYVPSHSGLVTTGLDDTNAPCPVLAHDAVRVFTVHGHTATRLADGMREWRLANLPVAT